MEAAGAKGYGFTFSGSPGCRSDGLDFARIRPLAARAASRGSIPTRGPGPSLRSPVGRGARFGPPLDGPSDGKGVSFVQRRRQILLPKNTRRIQIGHHNHEDNHLA